jgi:hypothetical protein
VTDEFLWAPLRSRLRWPLAALAVISAAAHLPVLSEHVNEAPYMGLEFIVFIVACLLIAGVAAAAWDTAALYAVAAITCASAVATYITTRVVAPPDLADDVGNWLEPLGVVSILSETAVVIVAICVISQRHWGATS